MTRVLLGHRLLYCLGIFTISTVGDKPAQPLERSQPMPQRPAPWRKYWWPSSPEFHSLRTTVLPFTWARIWGRSIHSFVHSIYSFISIFSECLVYATHSLGTWDASVTVFTDAPRPLLSRRLRSGSEEQMITNVINKYILSFGSKEALKKKGLWGQCAYRSCNKSRPEVRPSFLKKFQAYSLLSRHTWISVTSLLPHIPWNSYKARLKSSGQEMPLPSVSVCF